MTNTLPERHKTTLDAGDLLDVNETLALLGISKRTLDRYQKAGLISPVRAIHKKGADRRFAVEDLRKLHTKGATA